MRAETLIVIVRDNGKGIAPANFDRALARFSQITPTSGSGLGLPIAQAITEAFGGQIKLASSGQTFTVEMQFLLPDQQV